MAVDAHRVFRLFLIVLAAISVSADSDSSSSSGRNAEAELATQPNSSTFPPLVVDDSNMGIQMYAFPVVLSEDIVISGMSFADSELRVYLRLFCTDDGGISVQGFAGLLPDNPAFPAASYFYKQPSELQPLLRLSVSSSSSSSSSSSQGKTGGSWPLWWKDTVTHKSDMGFWPIIGPSNLKVDSLSLRLKGSSLQHPLHLPVCTLGTGSTVSISTSTSTSTSSGSVSSSRGSSHFSIHQQHDRDVTGMWNVVTTTDPNLIPAEKMARLLLLHSRYHQRLGFQGTILRCNQDEAHLLAALPQLKTELLAEKLIIWPWVGGQSRQKDSSSHPIDPQPYFWQVPRNQITLLAGYGRRLQLAFLDMDEYMVLPGGGNLSSSQCHLRPTLDSHFGVITLARYPGLCSNCTGEELDCWDAANKLGNAGRLRITQCPCLLGKPVLTAGKVVNTRVHKAAPAVGFYGIDLDPRCAYVVHLQALISSARPWDRPWDLKPRNDTLLYGDWVAPVQGTGVVKLLPHQQGLLSAHECVKSGQEVLRRCSQA
ncbi:hypothetical protein COO60DRAFT_380132 [Scenedesmus sp. NREL 46B-D3]|nr:hypothetical protein COO60DRAFT_380132 [Scenedesmus sp. NREL 46B-D3]